MNSLAVLLPPSEGRPAAVPAAGSPTRAASQSSPASGEPCSGHLRAALSDDTFDAAKLFGVGGKALEQAESWGLGVSRSPVAPAHERYTGVVHQHLDVAGLPPRARHRASESVVVVSGLLGLVGIEDPVPEYRLKMGARLPELGLMSTWWRDQLTAALRPVLEGAIVLDLLPAEHAKAWVPEPEAYRSWIQVRFVREGAGGERRTVGHEAKAAKGLLARHVLTSRRVPLGALEDFDQLGYRLDGGDSDLDPADGSPILLTYVSTT